MKTFGALVSVFAFLNPAPEARFEDGGVRVGGHLVRGPVIELREGLLVSGDVVEPLGAVVALDVAPGRTLRLEPGIRAARSVRGLLLSTHGGRALRLSAGGRVVTLAGPVAVRASEKGWDAGDSTFDGAALLVQVKPQDDPDASLRAMQEDARRMETRPGTRPSRRRRTAGPGDPLLPSSAAIDKEVLLTSPFLSPFGN